jgi:AcrR family transcriptional regulator
LARTIAKDHDQKREQILKSAAKVFADQGFDRASMNLLAKECGISKANIYHYYDSKDALLFDLLDSYLRDLRDRVCGIDMEGMSPEQRLSRTVSEVLLAYQGADNEHRVQSSGLSALPAEQQKILRGYQREMVDQMSDIIRDIAPDVFADDKRKLYATTMSVYGMLNWFYMWNSQADEASREIYAKLVSDLTLKGVPGL